MAKGVVFQAPRGAIPVKSKDPSRYKGSFGIRSQSSNAIYVISFDTAQGCWVCSCRGCISHGKCKHLRTLGLKGRTEGWQPLPTFVDDDPHGR